MTKANNKKLVIVESPAKASTIEKFLGSEYRVISSFGHIRDLPKSKMGVNITNNYEPDYIINKDKQKVASQLKKEASSAELVLLASDEDREGEAIAWHISQIINTPKERTKRIVFREITESVIKEAILHPREIDMNLVNAQQARRILDRLVGYELSPLLWKKVRRGLSAGRVQSVAVRLIVEREKAITSFADKRFFKLSANLKCQDGSISALYEDEIEGVQQAKTLLQQLADSDLSIGTIDSQPKARTAPIPFTTSTLQQNASIRLGMSVKQTMVLAQKLYEAGHITYMRTDSLNIAISAKSAIAAFIKNTYGDKYLGEARFYKASKGAQEAHEAIRPTNINIESAGQDERQKRLYDLIRSQTLASQMADAQYLKNTIEIIADKMPKNLQATGMQITFPGYMASGVKGIKEEILPKVTTGEKLTIIDAQAHEKLKQPPARYSEASLVKALEKLGIGRPSTYAPIISTVQDRGYVVKQDNPGKQVSLLELRLLDGVIKEISVDELYGNDHKRLAPTDIGIVVNEFLENHFKSIVDYNFTAQVEKQFDEISEGRVVWQDMIDEFYKPFHKTLNDVDSNISRSDTGSVRELGTEPSTNEPIVVKLGRYGPVIQIGVGSKETPPRFAPFPKNRTLNDITMEEALKMASLPRVIGNSADGQVVEASIGRFGPYIKHGKQYVSITEEKVFTVTVEEAETLLKEKKEASAKTLLKTFPDSEISVKTGRFGPYVTNGKLNASIPKKISPDSITVEQAKELLINKESRKKRHK